MKISHMKATETEASLECGGNTEGPKQRKKCVRKGDGREKHKERGGYAEGRRKVKTAEKTPTDGENL